jgi:PAS domain S-box-containing protein
MTVAASCGKIPRGEEQGMERLDIESPADAAAANDAPAHLAHLFALSPDLLAAAGFDGLLKLFNASWSRQLGYPDEVLRAKPYLDLVHPDDLDATRAVIGRLAQGEYIDEYECRILHATGAVRIYQWSGGPGDDAFYIVGRDVTERRALDAELALRAERLERTNGELQEFAYIASHDLSEPLRMVTSYMDLLERRYGRLLDDQGREFVRFASDGAERMRQLIDDLLLYSRVANEAPARDVVDLQAVVAEVLVALGPAIEDAAARVEVSALPSLVAERTQMARLLQNLIGNAVKFHGQAPPRVAVSATRDPSGWVITVADDGVGVEPADRERIFAMFTRLPDSSDVPGTGIGLAICRRIAERHGGRIWVESEAGAGSAFHVLLPDAA